MGPHPAVAQVRSAVRAALHGLDGPVFVACSGGADSLALAAATAFEASRAGVAAGLVTIDHGLQDGSAAQAQRVATVGAELGLDPVVVLPVQVDADGGPEGAARRARYAALDALAAAHGAHVLLGHTRDDQAETVLLGLARGSGPRSVAGMRARNGPYLRPLLQLDRATIAAACAALGLTPWVDPHNSDPYYRRVRVRTEVLPLLEDVLAGGAAAALARTAELLQDDLDALDGWAQSVLAKPVPAQSLPTDSVAVIVAGKTGIATTTATKSLEVAMLTDLPRAVRTRVLRLWAARAGADPLTAERTDALDGLSTRWRGQGPIELPGGVSVRRVGGQLHAEPSAPDRTPEPSARLHPCPNSTPT